jgi:hypothetical protein
MKPRLYIEASVISYFTSLPSRDLIAMHAGRTHRRKLVISDPIIEEVRRTRKEIEAEHGDDWKALERYFIDKQKSSPEKKAAYKPKKLPGRRTP